jgi:hypothetical protein
MARGCGEGRRGGDARALRQIWDGESDIMLMHGIGTDRERTTRVYMEDCACQYVTVPPSLMSSSKMGFPYEWKG